jgi:hypothetical protein
MVLGMLALTIGVALAGCGKKDAGGSGGSSGGDDVSVSVSVPKAGKAAPATDFTYDLSEDGKGVVIKTYTGDGGALVIPAEIEKLPVVELYERAFYGETDSSYGPGYGLTSVVIPASVKKIGDQAFMRCGKLTSVTIQGTGVEVGFGAFRYCTDLSELVIPEGDNVLVMTDLDFWSAYDAFVGCKKLPLAMRSSLNAMGFTKI